MSLPTADGEPAHREPATTEPDIGSQELRAWAIHHATTLSSALDEELESRLSRYSRRPDRKGGRILPRRGAP